MLNVRERDDLDEIQYLVTDTERAIGGFEDRITELKTGVTALLDEIMNIRVAMEALNGAFPVHAVIRIQAGPSGV